eukprot:TRINITY_DN2384_c0_g1_i1.p1 TRINITY_DN2384_c0_g1~~TRINITY_DN2384_c0_g1_i1.p1  ORF type:complete len:238 (+),score=72.62 TRINITY_DN2384_c0_g1_i1:118-831(+)
MAETKKNIAVVTGANKGIGKAIVGELAKLNFTVFLAARDEQRGQQTARELASFGDVRFLKLDVMNPESITQAVKAVEAAFGKLDVLVNNAAISGTSGKVSDLGSNAYREVFETNLFGVVDVTNAFLPLLRKSSAPRIVNLSSTLGSLNFGAKFPDCSPYCVSKTALNALTVQYAEELKDVPNLKINAVCPGFVATDLNGHQGHRSTDQGARIAIKMATLPADGPSGGYFNDAGTIPW